MKNYFTVVMTIFYIAPNILIAGEFAKLPEVKKLTMGQSKEVAFFIERTAECNHFGSEEPYDKQRAQELKNAIEKAGCNKLEVQEKILKEKYKADKKVLTIIENAKTLN
jgi:hypothetical protein